MYLHKIEVCNLLSFDLIQNTTNENTIKDHGQHTNDIFFNSDVSLIVGPNNSGKSNIFRILRILLNTLESPGKGLELSSVFSSTGSSWLNIQLTFSKEETDIIIDFVSLLLEQSKEHASYPLKERENLTRLLDEISIKLSWSGFNILPQQFVRCNDIVVRFEKLGLEVIQLGNSFELKIAFEDKEYFPSSDIIELLGRSNSAEEFKNNFKKSQDLENVSHKLRLEKLGLKSPVLDEHESRISSRISNFIVGYGKLESLYFSRLISIILKRSLYFSNRVKSFTDRKGEYAAGLDDDGKNLAQFLFRLKNSSNMQNRNRFDIIQKKFENVFNGLRFDVICSNYDDNKIENEPDTDQITGSIQIVYTDENLVKQFPLERGGTGLSEVLFLLTLSYGISNSVILLDEPALNTTVD